MISQRTARFSFGFVAILAATSIPAADTENIRFTREANTVFLNGPDVAGELGYKFKIVSPRLATFCREGSSGICIPVRLTKENHRGAGKDLVVAADALASALRFRVTDIGEKARIARSELPTVGGDIATPAYNAAWGKGRGFRQGETLPDIPLVNLTGDEVRFSQFLGKRYILYCWASW